MNERRIMYVGIRDPPCGDNFGESGIYAHFTCQVSICGGVEMSSPQDFHFDGKDHQKKKISLNLRESGEFGKQFKYWLGKVKTGNPGLVAEYSKGIHESYLISAEFAGLVHSKGILPETRSAMEGVGGQVSLLEMEKLIERDPKGQHTSEEEIASVLRQGMLCDHLISDINQHLERRLKDYTF
tara:strand:+ start:771 stop:1319 length:549 start_codon:yes stop_codon:yes gene_type:complete